ncbi:hypothetical protein B4135_1309 [Caldibacillus debilis]|uniref:Uncharacterized protein n=1 Tax=Caldibacillus debilis TaxID=301148 RepID=A0A150MDB7_9BACI|nr:hypothetical protein B4135_1309 [Caldibacillus debilis]
MGGKAADHSGEDRRCAPLTDSVKERAATEMGPGERGPHDLSKRTSIRYNEDTVGHAGSQRGMAASGPHPSRTEKIR